jgi:hypothetical protein
MSPGLKILGIVVVAAAFAVVAWRARRSGRRRAPDVPTDEQSMEFLRANTRALVWGGFHTRDEIIEMLPEVSGVDADESVLAPLVDAEFGLKRAAEKEWPERTDCDRLDEAFEALNRRGIFARQYQGYTQGDGEADLSEALQEAKSRGGKFTGYCFYTAQDVEGLIEGGRGLCLAFGTNLEQVDEVREALGMPNNVGAVEAGKEIVRTLGEFGFETTWDGTPETRIEIRHIDWKRRRKPGRK